MRLKTILFCSVASVLIATGANAADSVIIPEPEAVDYVRVCDAYGTGYFYIPGTETCLRIHGHVRYEATAGDDVYSRGFESRDDKLFENLNTKRDSWDKLARFALRLSTATETEYGALTSFTEMRFQWKNGNDDPSTGTLRKAYMQLGGLRVGLDDSAFKTFAGDLGDVINDDVILSGGYRTGLISYTFAAHNGFSAILSLGTR